MGGIITNSGNGRRETASLKRSVTPDMMESYLEFRKQALRRDAEEARRRYLRTGDAKAFEVAMLGVRNSVQRDLAMVARWRRFGEPYPRDRASRGPVERAHR